MPDLKVTYVKSGVYHVKVTCTVRVTDCDDSASYRRIVSCIVYELRHHQNQLLYEG